MDRGPSGRRALDEDAELGLSGPAGLGVPDGELRRGCPFGCRQGQALAESLDGSALVVDKVDAVGVGGEVSPIVEQSKAALDGCLDGFRGGSAWVGRGGSDGRVAQLHLERRQRAIGLGLGLGQWSGPWLGLGGAEPLLWGTLRETGDGEAGRAASPEDHTIEGGPWG